MANHQQHPAPAHRKNGSRNIWIGVIVAFAVPALSLLVAGTRLAAGIEENTDDIAAMNVEIVPRPEIEAKFSEVRSELGNIKTQNIRILEKLDRALERPATPIPRYAPGRSYYDEPADIP